MSVHTPPSSSPAPDVPAADHEVDPAAGLIDRAALLRAGPTPVPRKFIIGVAIGFLVLGLGGVVGEKLLGNTGVGTPAAAPTNTPVTPSGEIAKLASQLDLVHLHAASPPPLGALETASGAPWALSQDRGRVVAVTFFNNTCNDVCPVEARELADADHLLGARRDEVEFVVINTDPLTALSTSAATSPTTSLQGVPNVVFVNGTLAALNEAWENYGVKVTLQTQTRLVTHNDIMYFVTPRGALVDRITPVADESLLGNFSLPASAEHHFAQGIASLVESIRSPS